MARDATEALTAVPRPKLADLVTTDLRRRIAHGEYPEGGRLPTAQSLVVQYGVSRPTLREVYRVLEADGLLERDPEKRTQYTVRMPSLEAGARHTNTLLAARGSDVDDVLDTCAILGAAIAGRVAERVQQGEVSVGELTTSAATHHTFHDELGLLSGSTTLVTLLGLFETAIGVRPGSSHHHEPEDHLRLVDLIQHHSVREVAESWHAHLQSQPRARRKPRLGQLVRQPRDQAALLAHRLRSAMANGELAAGVRLAPETALGQLYDAPRTVLRQALRILESEGLVTINRGARGGVTVTDPSPSRAANYLALLLQSQGTLVRDFLEARALVESALAERAVRTADHDLLITDLLQALKAEQAAFGDARAFAEAGVAFHEALARHCGGSLEVAFTILDAVQAQVVGGRIIQKLTQERMAHAHYDHLAFVHALTDPEQDAALLWRTHCAADEDLALVGDLSFLELFARR